MFINVADIVDETDPQKRTFREINLAKKHKYAIGTLVEFEDGVRLFIRGFTRDCDGTPLYNFGFDDNIVRRSYPEDGFTVVKE